LVNRFLKYFLTFLHFFAIGLAAQGRTIMAEGSPRRRGGHAAGLAQRAFIEEWQGLMARISFAPP
jgi:hypothetical protein